MTLIRSKKGSLIFILSIFAFFLFAQEKHFEQKIEWKSDDNAFEYKVEVKNSSTGETSVYNTSDNFIELNLPSGNYQYQVTVYDFLGREYDVSIWQNFEISKASKPSIQNLKKEVEGIASGEEKITIPLQVESVAEGTLVSLVNEKTKEKVQGKLILDSATTSEVASASEAEFPKVSDGEWRIVVENPSGNSSSSETFTLKTTDNATVLEKERLAKEEAERIAKEEAERLEAERLEKQEAERLAKEEAERLEAERLAKEEAERLEAERLAKEETERLEAERLAKEEARKLEEEKSPGLIITLTSDSKEDSDAFNEEDDLEKADENFGESDSKSRKKHRALGIDLKGGLGMTLNVFDSDILSEKNYDMFFYDELPSFLSFTPEFALSIIPNFTWTFEPGLEVLLYGGALEAVEKYSSEFSSSSSFELQKTIPFEVLQANLILQIKLIEDKLVLNAKVGGGLFFVSLYTSYSELRPSSEHHFVYPKVNAGLSFEWIPFKHLVFELGTDYNIAVSNKVFLSYLSPYVLMGVRF